MLRNRVRRPFTVETKSSGQTRHVSIPSKQPRQPQKRTGRTETATLWPSLDAGVVVSQPPSEPVQERRRILPSLIVAEVQEVEPEPAIEPDELPRVRRVSRPNEATEGAPRRRGRPRKAAAEQITHQAVEMAEQVSQQPPQALTEAAPTISRRRPVRTGSDTLRLGERWKRRLPKVCW